jgi:hypothetical protein
METETCREPRLFRTSEDLAQARLEHQMARAATGSGVVHVQSQPVSDDVPQNQEQSGNCEAPGCTNPGGAFTSERDSRIYEFCSEACRTAFERPTG